MSTPKGLVLWIGIDFGTTYSAVAYSLRVRTPATATVLPALFPVYFNRERQTKSQIAWNNSRKAFAWGPEVDTALRRHEIHQKDCIQMLKIGLWKTEVTQSIRDVQQSQIDRIPKEQKISSIEDLIEVFLRRLFDHVKTFISAEKRLFSEDIFEKSKVKCSISTPAIWTAKMCEVMIKAAARAGIPNADIVSEPEAAAARIFQEEKMLMGRMNVSQRQSATEAVSGVWIYCRTMQLLD